MLSESNLYCTLFRYLVYRAFFAVHSVETARWATRARMESGIAIRAAAIGRGPNLSRSVRKYRQSGVVVTKTRIVPQISVAEVNAPTGSRIRHVVSYRYRRT